VRGAANPAPTRLPRASTVRSDRGDRRTTRQQPLSWAARGGRRLEAAHNSYTFTSDDAALGKVTFEAVATIVNARDALPADNTATALPTKVNG
jgi:hypothetical protein